MYQTFNSDGRRNRDYRPYIFSENTTYNTSLYDPFRSVDYGLYSNGVPPPAKYTQEDLYFYNQKRSQPYEVKGALPPQNYQYQRYSNVHTGGSGTHHYRKLFAT